MDYTKEGGGKMINHNDLRTGNYVHDYIASMEGLEYRDDIFTQVKGITETGINPYLFKNPYVTDIRDLHSFKNIRPIHLTEEWLLKLGFDNEKEHKFMIKHDHTEYIFQIRQHLPKETPSCGFMGVKFRKESIPSYSVEGEESVFEQNESETYFAWGIKYVHQLQNLYYALTGEELITSPTASTRTPSR